MNVLSLFDGISGARLALEAAGFKVNEYFSSEVDKSCVQVSSLRFPDQVSIGDVRDIRKKNLPKIDLLIGGSPCQDLSNAFKGDGLAGARSSLFYEYVRLLDELKPKAFLLENVQNSHKHLMDDEIGVAGVAINSALFSAQSRPRCYWTNIDIPTLPTDNKIVMKDILEREVDEYFYLDNRISRATVKNLNPEPTRRSSGIIKLGDIDHSVLRDNERQRRVYSVKGKSPTLLARTDTPKILANSKIRKLTPLECERLQCIPDNFTEGFSMSSRYKMVGNGFTVSVVQHILSGMNSNKRRR
jgi:DNA-cytosine methyltransferase